MTVLAGRAREGVRVESVPGDGAYLPLRPLGRDGKPEAWECLVLEADPALSEREGELVARTSSWLLDWTKEMGSGRAGDDACHARRAARQAAFEEERKRRMGAAP